MAEAIDIGTVGEAIRVAGYGIAFMCAREVPTSGQLGYAHGAILLNLSGSTSADSVYFNIGNSASCDFRAVGSFSELLDENGNLIIENIVPMQGTARELSAVLLPDGAIATTSDTLEILLGDGLTNGGRSWDPRGIILAPVDSATVITVGDFLYLATDDARPAASAADTGTEVGNQQAFHDAFLGIAMEASANGETEPIYVATKGRHTVNVDSGNYMVGDLLGLDEQAGGTALENQNLVGVGSTALAVGRCASFGTSLTSVEIDIVSTILYGGPMPV